MTRKGRISFFIFIVSLVCFLLTYTVVGIWVPFLWLPVVFGVVAFPAWIFYDKKNLLEFLTLKTTKSGMSMGLLIVLVVLGLGFVNYLGARHVKTFDFSNNQINTLSDQSQKVIQSLDDDLTVRFFYKRGVEGSENNKMNIQHLTSVYKDASPRVKFEAIEVNEDPALSKEYGVSSGQGEAFVAYKGKKNKIENYQEQDFTNAVIKLTHEKSKVVYFTIGHGERNTDDLQSDTGGASARSMLEKNSLEVRKLSFLEKAEVPADASAVVIIGPNQPFQNFEVKALESYLLKGGSILMALDPEEKIGSLEELLNKIGVKYINHYVFNLVNTNNGVGVDTRVPTIGASYSATNPITKLFKNSEMVNFVLAGSLERKSEVPGITVEEIVKTPAAAVSLETMKSQSPQGPPREFTLAMAMTGRFPGLAADAKPESEFRMVAFADSDFLNNTLIFQKLNRDLFLNSVSSLVKDEGLISITPKEPGITKITVTRTISAVLLISFLGISLALLATSIVLVFRRRHA